MVNLGDKNVNPPTTSATTPEGKPNPNTAQGRAALAQQAVQQNYQHGLEFEKASTPATPGSGYGGGRVSFSRQGSRLVDNRLFAPNTQANRELVEKSGISFKSQGQTILVDIPKEQQSQQITYFEGDLPRPRPDIQSILVTKTEPVGKLSNDVIAVTPAKSSATEKQQGNMYEVDITEHLGFSESGKITEQRGKTIVQGGSKAIISSGGLSGNFLTNKEISSKAKTGDVFVFFSNNKEIGRTEGPRSLHDVLKFSKANPDLEIQISNPTTEKAIISSVKQNPKFFLGESENYWTNLAKTGALSESGFKQIKSILETEVKHENVYAPLKDYEKTQAIHDVTSRGGSFNIIDKQGNIIKTTSGARAKHDILEAEKKGYTVQEHFTNPLSSPNAFLKASSIYNKNVPVNNLPEFGKASSFGNIKSNLKSYEPLANILGESFRSTGETLYGLGINLGGTVIGSFQKVNEASIRPKPNPIGDFYSNIFHGFTGLSISKTIKATEEKQGEISIRQKPNFIDYMWPQWRGSSAKLPSKTQEFVESQQPKTSFLGSLSGGKYPSSWASGAGSVAGLAIGSGSILRIGSFGLILRSISPRSTNVNKETISKISNAFREKPLEVHQEKIGGTTELSQGTELELKPTSFKYEKAPVQVQKTQSRIIKSEIDIGKGKLIGVEEKVPTGTTIIGVESKLPKGISLTKPIVTIGEKGQKVTKEVPNVLLTTEKESGRAVVSSAFISEKQVAFVRQEPSKLPKQQFIVTGKIHPAVQQTLGLTQVPSLKDTFIGSFTKGTKQYLSKAEQAGLITQVLGEIHLQSLEDVLKEPRVYAEVSRNPELFKSRSFKKGGAFESITRPKGIEYREAYPIKAFEFKKEPTSTRLNKPMKPFSAATESKVGAGASGKAKALSETASTLITGKPQIENTLFKTAEKTVRKPTVGTVFDEELSYLQYPKGALITDIVPKTTTIQGHNLINNTLVTQKEELGSKLNEVLRSKSITKEKTKSLSRISIINISSLLTTPKTSTKLKEKTQLAPKFRPFTNLDFNQKTKVKTTQVLITPTLHTLTTSQSLDFKNQQPTYDFQTQKRRLKKKLIPSVTLSTLIQREKGYRTKPSATGLVNLNVRNPFASSFNITVKRGKRFEF